MKGRLVRTLGWSAAASLAIGALVLTFQDTAISWAKEFTLTGTVDCGVRSGRNCSFEGTNPTMIVNSKDFGATEQSVLVDVSGIMKHLRERDIEQDDPICMDVEEIPGPVANYRATGYISLCDEKGTNNPGLSTEDHNQHEQDHGDDDDDDDDDD